MNIFCIFQKQCLSAIYVCQKQTKIQQTKAVTKGRGPGTGEFTMATTSIIPGYFHTKQKENKTKRTFQLCSILCLLIIYTQRLEILLTALQIDVQPPIYNHTLLPSSTFISYFTLTYIWLKRHPKGKWESMGINVEKCLKILIRAYSVIMVNTSN